MNNPNNVTKSAIVESREILNRKRSPNIVGGDITSEDIMEYVRDLNLCDKGITNYSLFLIFCGMNVASVDGRRICPDIFEEGNFLSNSI